MDRRSVVKTIGKSSNGNKIVQNWNELTIER